MISDDIRTALAAFSRRSVIQGAAAVSVVSALGVTMGAFAATKPSPSERAARNLQIAQKFYDAYHNAPERGALVGAFDPADIADGCLFCSPFIGGERPLSGEMAKGAAANNARIRKRLPNYRMEDFSAWPTEWGCAWRWRVTGRPARSDDLYEFWEMLYIWTNDEGKITRFEFFDDWHGFAASTAFAWEQSLDEFTKIKNYGNSPWTPPPVTKFNAPATPALKPTSERAAANLALARKFYDAYHTAQKVGSLPDGPFEAEDFAEGCAMFSPSIGELVLPPRWDAGPRKKFEYRVIRNKLPDYNMDQFAAWPTDDGCAWRWLVNGHSKAGAYYEFWEQIFIRTNADGKITRFEYFDDFLGFPQMLGFLTGVSLEAQWLMCESS